MLTLTKEQCIALIRAKQCFHAVVDNGAFIIKIKAYSPIIAAAIHNGSQLRLPLQQTILLSETERFFEEDPYTADFIGSFPITLIGNDSRFEYDLNRPKAQAIYYKTAWGKKVWPRPLSKKQRSISQAKHASFYQILSAIVEVTEAQFSNALIFDVHSYNYRRIDKKTPTFNIGTGQIDIERWGKMAIHCKKRLNPIKLIDIAPQAEIAHVKNTRGRINKVKSYAACDEVFQGRGYLISHINAHFDNTLVLPIEIKKVFMDELTGALHSARHQQLCVDFQQALNAVAKIFTDKYVKEVVC